MHRFQTRFVWSKKIDFELSRPSPLQALTTKTKLKELKGAMPPEMAKALGKLRYLPERENSMSLAIGCS